MEIKTIQNQNNQQNHSGKTLGMATGLAIGLSPFAIKIKNSFSTINDKGIEKRKKTMSVIVKELDSFENLKKHADEIIAKEHKRGNKIKLWIINNKTVDKYLPLKNKNPKIINQRKTMVNGLNGFWKQKANAILINDKKSYSFIFHEIGHSKNYYSKLTRPLTNISRYSKKTANLVALSCLAIGIFTDKKPKNKTLPPENRQKKTFRDFIHNNAGKIIFAWSLPVIAEESLASLRGFKLAKNYLTKTQQKTHIRNQILALGSYIVKVALFSGAIAFSIWIKDKINQKEKPKEA